MHPGQATLATQLLQLNERSQQQQFIQEHAASFSEADVQALKDAADQYLRADLMRSRFVGHLLLAIAHQGGGDLPRAVGTLVRANANGISGVGEFACAVRLYNRAAQLYTRLGRPRDQARAQIGKIYCLSQLSCYREIEETEAWAREVLEQETDWVGLSRLTSNVGIAYSRRGDEVASLAMFDAARNYCIRAGEHQNSNLPNIEHNRSLALRTLGRFDESIAASERALALHLDAGSYLEAARAQQNLATTYFVLGRFNEALTILDEVRQAFAGDERTRDTVRVDLYISDCLLQLRRFTDVLMKCRQVREQMMAKGVQHEVAQAMLNEAVAYAGLHQYAEAQHAATEARAIFALETNLDGMAYVDLQLATLAYYRQEYAPCRELALQCVASFAQREKPVEQAYAYLIAARACLSMGELADAGTHVAAALELGTHSMLPALTYQCRHLLGTIANQQGDRTLALAEYDEAIAALEHLRGRLMLEYRAAYIEDKQVVYEDAVRLCLEDDKPERALEYVEQAKSRTLLDLLAHRLNLHVEARAPADQPLLDELTQLRTRRDQLYRQWEGSEEIRATPFVTRDVDYQQAQTLVAELEERITALWHTLLIRNADYARDAALWRTRSEPVQPLLDSATLLVEYFVAREQFIVFLVSKTNVTSIKLTASPAQLSHALRLLRMNMAAVPLATTAQQLDQLQISVQRILQRLYEALIQPIASQLAPYRQLMIVPHGMLHYLPFHALHTGERYWIEEVEISYLPSASYLHYCRPLTHGQVSEEGHALSTTDKRLFAFGNSAHHQLPYAVTEARAVVTSMGGQALVEEDATKAYVAKIASEADILHFAVHADFRADNPLFCGLALADGWLTTLDIFELKLSAALVTLSACQTGRSVIGGGDELLGLMRAWISAGATSLVLSYWPVEDLSAAQLMTSFYHRLAEGATKRAALRGAQLDLLTNETGQFVHPYFWAAYFLVGSPDALQ